MIRGRAWCLPAPRCLSGGECCGPSLPTSQGTARGRGAAERGAWRTHAPLFLFDDRFGHRCPSFSSSHTRNATRQILGNASFLAALTSPNPVPHPPDAPLRVRRYLKPPPIPHGAEALLFAGLNSGVGSSYPQAVIAGLEPTAMRRRLGAAKYRPPITHLPGMVFGALGPLRPRAEVLFTLLTRVCLRQLLCLEPNR